MSFQWIFDTAQTITPNNKSIVSSTTTRSGIVRSTERGAAPWVFTVTLPTGLIWTQYRSQIGSAKSLDRTGVDTVNFRKTGFEWMFQYQGDAVGTQTGSWTAGSKTVTITDALGGFTWRYRAGDIVELDNRVYEIVEDVAEGATEFTVHRPIYATGSGEITVGPDCDFRVKCVQFPEFTWVTQNRIGWEAPFIFVEEV